MVGAIGLGAVKTNKECMVSQVDYFSSIMSLKFDCASQFITLNISKLLPVYLEPSDRK